MVFSSHTHTHTIIQFGRNDFALFLIYCFRSSCDKVYISEIASPDVRGFLSAIQKIAGHLGILISYSLGAYLDWRQLAMLVSIAPMLLFLTVIYIPETPSFLILNGRNDEAYRYAHNLMRITPSILFDLSKSF